MLSYAVNCCNFPLRLQLFLTGQSKSVGLTKLRILMNKRLQKTAQQTRMQIAYKRNAVLLVVHALPVLTQASTANLTSRVVPVRRVHANTAAGPRTEIGISALHLNARVQSAVRRATSPPTDQPKSADGSPMKCLG